MLVAHDAEVRVFPRRFEGTEGDRRFVGREDRGESIAPGYLSRELHPAFGVDNVPGVNSLQKEILLGRPSQVEVFAPLQEEWSLFGEKEVVTEVDIHLPGIGLDLAEVRINGRV